MISRFAAISMLAILAMTPVGHASGKKDTNASVSFHMETEATDNPKMIFPQLANGHTRYFRRMPEFMTKDIVAFSPFPSEAGDDYGLVLKLKNNGINRLSAISNANQGRWMISQVNGRIVDGILIDKQVDDGILVIWKGITLADIAVLDKQLQRIGEEGKKK